MEHFKEKLKIENRITAVLCIILACFTVLGFLAEANIVELTPVSGDNHWQSMWRGMLSGASFGVLALMFFGLIRGTAALKDEKKLKKLYIKANDERQIQIDPCAASQKTHESCSDRSPDHKMRRRCRTELLPD